MMNVTTILEAMNKGITVDEIAKQFTDALNQANSEYTAKKQADEKKTDARKLVDSAYAFMQKYNSNMCKDIVLTEEDLDNCAEMVIDAFKEMEKFYAISPFERVLHLDMEPIKKPTEKADPISIFLENFGLK